MSRKTCQQCGQDFLIVNDVPIKLNERDWRQYDSRRFAVAASVYLVVAAGGQTRHLNYLAR
jgi:hypothetical protein